MTWLTSLLRRRWSLAGSPSRCSSRSAAGWRYAPWYRPQSGTLPTPSRRRSCRRSETPGCGYLWEYLTYHLQAAGLGAELDEVCCELRFLAVRLRRSGPAAVEADLARSGSPTAERLRRVVAQNAHLLCPAEPPAAVITTFTSRLGGIPELASQLPALRSALHAWTAWPSWPPPDLPSDTLIRVLTGHDDSVLAVAVAPNGTWLAPPAKTGRCGPGPRTAPPALSLPATTTR